MAATSRTFKEPVAALTHFGGLLVAVVSACFLVALCAHDAVKSAAMGVYGASLIGLFAASSTYHFFDLGTRGNQWLRRLDHTAIFLLIAGTYVPPILHLLDGMWRVSMLAAIGALATAGIAFRLLWSTCPRPLYVSAYVAMGWVGVIPAHLMLPQLSVVQLVWLVGGGLAYTVGAVIYALKRPDPWPGVFGFHEIWHVFVLAGAFAHVGFTLTLVGAPYPPL